MVVCLTNPNNMRKAKGVWKYRCLLLFDAKSSERIHMKLADPANITSP